MRGLGLSGGGFWLGGIMFLLMEVGYFTIDGAMYWFLYFRCEILGQCVG